MHVIVTGTSVADCAMVAQWIEAMGGSIAHSARVADANEWLLKQGGENGFATWGTHPLTVEAPDLREFHRRCEMALEGGSGGGPIVLADPNFCFTWKHWSPLVAEPCIVLVRRSAHQACSRIAFDHDLPLSSATARWAGQLASLMSVVESESRVGIDIDGSSLQSTGASVLYDKLVARGVTGLQDPRSTAAAAEEEPVIDLVDRMSSAMGHMSAVVDGWLEGEEVDLDMLKDGTACRRELEVLQRSQLAVATRDQRLELLAGDSFRSMMTAERELQHRETMQCRQVVEAFEGNLARRSLMDRVGDAARVLISGVTRAERRARGEFKRLPFLVE